MIDKFYEHMCRYYHIYSICANLLIAISLAGLMTLGVVMHLLIPSVMISLGVMFCAIYIAGKFLDQEIDDIDKVKEHTNRKGGCNHEQNDAINSDSVNDKPVI